MRPGELDFHASPRAGVGGWLLLAVALAVCVAEGGAGVALERERAALADRAAMLADKARAGAGQPAGRDEVAAAQRAVDALNRPWAELFASLEAVDLEDVALLSLNPDVASGELRIAAEARDLDAMFAFHRRIEAQPTLTAVALLRHEPAGDGATPVVRFELRAQWGAGDGRP